MNGKQFGWNKGQFNIAKRGAMCAPISFHLDGGRKIEPMMVAPWCGLDDPRFDDLPPLLQNLRGEWPCVPFGMPQILPNLPQRWHTDNAQNLELGDYFHGPSSNLDWQIETDNDGGALCTLDYPSHHPIGQLTRRIRGLNNLPKVEFELAIKARRSTSLPIGIHPIFKLPSTTGASKLNIKGDVHTYPVAPEAGASQLIPDQHSLDLSCIPALNERFVDLTSHPLPFDTEELVLITNCDGRAVLENNEEGYKVILTWDKIAFPSCNLWISNRGRCGFPWDSKFQAIGIEPVAAPFDLGPQIALDENNPLARQSIVCGASFCADKIWRTSYSIEVEAL